VFEIKSQDLFGRIGVLHTKSGSIETPYIFPVVDPTLKKQNVGLDEIKELGFNAVITNAYLILRNYGSIGDVHKLLGFDGIVMTDSGAYQLMQYGEVEVSNREIMEFQCSIKSDIGVPLDIPTKVEDPREKVFESVIETLSRVRESVTIIEKCKGMLWVAPIQGGTQLDLLRYCAKKIVDQGLFEVYNIAAVGSPTTLLERFLFDHVMMMLKTVREEIPSAVPLHLFGAGHPLVIPFVVAMGVDLMDSASYIIYARDNRYMTWRGTYRLEELSYFPCECPICRRYEPRDLLEMDKSERTRLLALHNLYVLKSEIDRVKQSIREGRLWEYLEEVSKRHPAARRAFEALVRAYPKLFMKRLPTTRVPTKAVFIFDRDSILNPRVVKARISLERVRYVVNKKKLALLPLLQKWKPLITSKLARELLVKGFAILGYVPAIGVVPMELSEAFPFSQFEQCRCFDEETISNTALIIQEFVERYVDTIDEVRILVCKDVEWSVRIAKKVLRNLKLCLKVKDLSVRLIAETLVCGYEYSLE